MKRALWATAVVAIAVALLVAFTVPPARLVLSRSDDGTVVGVLHIHTNRSDGRSSPAEVAAAAGRAGLKFIVFTDHGDATRRPDPPVYRDGVLCLDGVEISTTGGHYVAIGLPPAPYPLGGEPRDVVEDVARLGGFGIVAHGDSPKHDLRWDGWNAPFNGLEIINPDTSWRVHATERGFGSKLRLLGAIATFPFRGPETIAGLLTDPRELTARWEALASQRPVVLVSGTDAHALIGVVPMPAYETSFRMLTVHIKPDSPFSGDAVRDGEALVKGLRAGHVYTTVDGYATNASFKFTARNAAGRADQGDELPAAGPVSLTVESNAPPTYVTRVFRGSEVFATSEREPSFTITGNDAPGIYRVEIRDPTRPGLPPWLVSNPIYLRSAAAPPDPPPPPDPPIETRLLFDGSDSSVWRLEQGAESKGSLDVASPGPTGELHVRYALAKEERSDDRVVLLAAPPGVLAPYDRITFSARADRPMRLSVQLRGGRPGGPPERWQRSIYLDGTVRSYTIRFDDLAPLGDETRPAPPMNEVPYLLYVVDTTNAAAGASGEFWVSRVFLQR